MRSTVDPVVVAGAAGAEWLTPGGQALFRFWCRPSRPGRARETGGQPGADPIPVPTHAPGGESNLAPLSGGGRSSHPAINPMTVAGSSRRWLFPIEPQKQRGQHCGLTCAHPAWWIASCKVGHMVRARGTRAPPALASPRRGQPRAGSHPQTRPSRWTLRSRHGCVFVIIHLDALEQQRNLLGNDIKCQNKGSLSVGSFLESVGTPLAVRWHLPKPGPERGAQELTARDGRGYTATVLCRVVSVLCTVLGGVTFESPTAPTQKDPIAATSVFPAAVAGSPRRAFPSYPGSQLSSCHKSLETDKKPHGLCPLVS